MQTTPELKDYIRTIPDFPQPGIQFRDVTTLFGDPVGLRRAVTDLAAPFRDRQIAKVAGYDARGFIIGAAVAVELGAGFVPIRKAGKLPGETIRQRYALEYGEAELELHTDAVAAGERVLVVDDLLATGGTAIAGIQLLEQLGADIEACAFVIDLPDLGGRAALEKLGFDVISLCAFEGD